MGIDPLQQISGLALEHSAHRFQRAESHGLGAPVLQHGHVGRGEPDSIGEFPDTHLSLGQLDVDTHHDRHQMTASMSVRRVVALRSRARITIIRSPRTVTPVSSRKSRSGNPGSVAFKPT